MCYPVVSRRRWLLTAVTIVVGITVALSGSKATMQNADRSRTPSVDRSAGGFTLRRLSGPVAGDGRTWIAVNPTMGTSTVHQQDARFTVSLVTPTDDGDVRRWRLQFTEEGGGPVTLADAVSCVYVTPDSRWISFEPVDVIDVRTWRRYGLSRTFGIEPYVVLNAISADGRRLVFRRGCTFDCFDVPEEYYELGFPSAR